MDARAVLADIGDPGSLHPSRAAWVRTFAGDAAMAYGDLADALTAYRAGLAIAERLAAADPSNASWQRDLSVSHNKLGDVLVAQGQLAEALAAYRASQAIFERLAAERPATTGRGAGSGAAAGALRVYQIHSATFDSGVLDNLEVLDELARLKRRGMIIGLTLSRANQAEILRRARTINRDGEPLFGCVQATWNLLEPSAGPALAEARAVGMGVIIKEALANGRLTSRNAGAPVIGEGGALRQQAERLVSAWTPWRWRRP